MVCILEVIMHLLICMFFCNQLWYAFQLHNFNSLWIQKQFEKLQIRKTTFFFIWFFFCYSCTMHKLFWSCPNLLGIDQNILVVTQIFWTYINVVVFSVSGVHKSKHILGTMHKLFWLATNVTWKMNAWFHSKEANI